MVLRAVSMISELGVVTVTILDLVSGSDPYGSEPNKQQEWAAVIVSLATTVAAFCISLVGTGSSLSAAKVVASRIRNAVGAAVSKSASHA